MKLAVRFFCLNRKTWFLLGGSLLSVLVALGTVLAIWSSREAAIHDWESRLTSVTRMLTAHAEQSFTATDVVMRGIIDGVGEFRIENQDDLRTVFGSQQTFQKLMDAAKGVPQIATLTVVSNDGTVVASTADFLTPSTNLSESEYFHAHIKDPELGAFISAPLKSRATGEWTLHLSRKIIGPRGEMLGLFVTGIRADFFSNFYRSLQTALSKVELFRDDGVILSHHPVKASVMGASVADTTAFNTVLGDRRAAHAFQQNGWGAPNDSLSSIVALERDAIFPLIIAVSVNEDLFLREWKDHKGKFLIEGGAMILILIAATTLVVRLVSQLDAAQLQAMRAVEVKTRFAANVSHELRTPMNSIIVGTHQLLDMGLSLDSQKLASLVSLSAHQLLLHINDILDFSYYDARQFKIESAPFDVRQLASNCVAMACSLQNVGDAALHYTVDDAVPDVLLGDCGRITQVLLNLLSNGLKYTDAGSVILRVGYHDVPGKPGLLRLVVSDTGPGIAAHDQARIFQPFERGGALGAKRRGTGLGLTISKKIIQAMGGTIHLHSVVGAGSTFTVDLPLPRVTDSSRFR
ncbi:MAG: Signal transduction histidine kinase [Hyphomicrobiales bacterium]|nr:Signal transduction histidine kinase [Hyphomicrobiales bacterium]